MKTLFLETKYDGKININKIKIGELPEKIGLITTVQFVDHLKDIKDYLVKNDKKVFLEKGYQKYAGQILGCDVSSVDKIKSKAQAFLYIGDGRFHPTGLAFKQKKDVFCFNPFNNVFSKITKKEVDDFQRKIKVKKVKFLSAGSIGILVSTKKGQCNMKKAFDLKKKLEKQKKDCYIFVSETLDINEFENFNFIDIWVNTACPRIEGDSKQVINVQDV